MLEETGNEHTNGRRTEQELCFDANHRLVSGKQKQKVDECGKTAGELGVSGSLGDPGGPGLSGCPPDSTK